MLKQKIALTGKILTHSFQVRFVEFRNATVEHYKDSFDIFNTDSCLCHVFLALPLSLFLFCLLTHSLKSTFTPGLLINTKTMQPLTFFFSTQERGRKWLPKRSIPGVYNYLRA